MRRLKAYTNKVQGLSFVDFVTLGLVTAAFILVLTVFGSYLKASYFTKLARIEVPVATVKDSYMPGELIEGLFFGEVYYSGKVDYTRQLICPNYSEYIEDINTGGNVVKGSAVPREINGARSPIGVASTGVPLDVNCTIQFKNLYCIPYLFGCVAKEYSYYTQAFTFTNEVAPEKNISTDGREDALPLILNSANQSSSTQNQQQNNTTLTPTPAEDTPQTIEVCDPLINLLGIKIGQTNCRQENI